MNIKELLGDSYNEEMSAEDILKALEGVNLQNNTDELTKLKKALDKSSSEAAEFKRQLREKQSAEEAKAQEEAEARAKLQQDYDTLVHKLTVSDNEKKLIAIGFDSKLANESAEALANGDIGTAIANMQKHLEVFEKKIKADLLDSTPKPPAANSNAPSVTREQFNKMGYSERVELFNTNRELYNELSTSNEN